jgi:hypothetical protein
MSIMRRAFLGVLPLRRCSRVLFLLVVEGAGGGKCTVLTFLSLNLGRELEYCEGRRRMRNGCAGVYFFLDGWTGYFSKIKCYGT